MSAIQQMLIASTRGGPTLMSAITTLGVTPGLKLCLDAGDASSYNPGVQTDKWLDVAGSGYDFFRGTGTGSDAGDPTFNGAAGSRESYWSVDPGEMFTYDTTNETWMQNLHKNNAIFSFVAFATAPGGTGGANGTYMFKTRTAGSLGTGIYLRIDETSISLYVANAGAGVLSAIASVSVDFTGNLAMVGGSLNEATGAGGGFLYYNGAYAQVMGLNLFDSTYLAPSAGNATDTMSVCDCPQPGNSGTMACIAIWEGTKLSKNEMDAIWAAMRGRFGI